MKNDSLQEYYDVEGIDPDADIDVNIDDSTGSAAVGDWDIEAKRYCDGNRGNICAGDVNITLTSP